MSTNAKKGGGVPSSRSSASSGIEGRGVRPQTPKPVPSGFDLWVRRDACSGRFMDVRREGVPFKGMAKEPIKKK
jgi:hypothetical protein